MRHLTFEDFLEAVVRLASMVALPTDGTLDLASRATGATVDAGEFMLRLEANAPRAWDGFVAENRQQWSGEPRQPIWRAVDHLIAYFECVVMLYAKDAPAGSSRHRSPPTLPSRDV